MMRHLVEIDGRRAFRCAGTLFRRERAEADVASSERCVCLTVSAFTTSASAVATFSSRFRFRDVAHESSSERSVQQLYDAEADTDRKLRAIFPASCEIKADPHCPVFRFGKVEYVVLYVD